MERVTAFRAKTNFGELLSRVAAGEEIVITRHDKPVARLIPEGQVSLSDVRQAVADLKQLRQKMSQRPGFRRISAAEIRSARDEGRR
jgi:prevent-host-death family protein